MADELSFDWDKHNIEHIARHGVTPEEVQQAFANNPRDIDFNVIGGEERWTSLGHTDLFRVLVIVWTMRDDVVRPVTAFEATAAIRTEYAKAKGF